MNRTMDDADSSIRDEPLAAYVMVWVRYSASCFGFIDGVDLNVGGIFIVDGKMSSMQRVVVFTTGTKRRTRRRGYHRLHGVCR